MKQFTAHHIQSSSIVEQREAQLKFIAELIDKKAGYYKKLVEGRSYSYGGKGHNYHFALEDGELLITDEVLNHKVKHVHHIPINCIDSSSIKINDDNEQSYIFLKAKKNCSGFKKFVFRT